MTQEKDRWIKKSEPARPIQSCLSATLAIRSSASLT